MSTLPPIRRIVTGHDSEGKAIFDKDEVLVPANPIDPKGGPVPEGSLIPSFVTIGRTAGYPADAQSTWVDHHGKMQDLVGDDGVVCRIVDFPPVPEDAPDVVNLMHRTISLDYAVVLEGEIDLVLDDGLTKTMKKGDVGVQRGTVHLWKNSSGAMCRILFVLVPSKPIVVETTGEPLAATDTTHLQDEEAANKVIQRLHQQSK